jgi:hypothetical protein
MKHKIYILSLVMFLSFAFSAKADMTNYAYNSALILYPNPATSTAHIVLPDIALEKVRVYIIDLRGRIMQSLTFAPGGDQLDLDISNLPDGDYSIRVQELGFEPENIRLVKQ